MLLLTIYPIDSLLVMIYWQISLFRWLAYSANGITSQPRYIPCCCCPTSYETAETGHSFSVNTTDSFDAYYHGGDTKQVDSAARICLEW